MGEILRNVDDIAALDAWALRGTLPVWRGVEEFASRAGIGLTILSASVLAARALGHRDEGTWAAARAGFGPALTDALFNSQDALRSATQTAMLEAAHAHHLRSAFSFKTDPWLTLLLLQAGVLRDELRSLPAWLSTQRDAPIAVRQLVAEGQNYSLSFACFWNALAAVQRRATGSETVEALAERNPWWPGWEVADVCRVLEQSLHRTARHDVATCAAESSEANESERAQDARPDQSESPIPWAGPAERVGSDREIQEPEEVPLPSGPPLGTPPVWLDPTAEAFVVKLPKSMTLPPGPIALSGDRFRIGGTIDADRVVRWHMKEPLIRLPINGPSKRAITVEFADQAPLTQDVRLWNPEAYIVAYDLSAPERGALDPFVISFPPGRPFAILMHRSLTPSEAPTEERRLDPTYFLRIWRSGIPDGTTVSCEGEEVWRAETRLDPRRLLPIPPTILTAVTKGMTWGAVCDLIARAVPEGFVPSRACVGAQVLTTVTDGQGWRFPGYTLLPGMGALRRRGRIEGRWHGERATIPARIAMEGLPNGGALRDAVGWRPVDLDAPFDKAQHREATLWTPRPEGDDEAAWYVMEGPHPVARYPPAGVRVAAMRLAALGEPLLVAPRRFDLLGSFVSVAPAVTDSGIIASCSLDDERAIVSTQTPLNWTEGYTAVTWSARGVRQAHDVRPMVSGTELLVPLSEETPSGLAIFYKGAWLGTAHLVRNPLRATAHFLRQAPEWPGALRLAIIGRLPLLASEPLKVARSRLYANGRGTVQALFGQPVEPYQVYPIGRLLEGWRPDPALSRWLVEEFRAVLPTASRSVTPLDALFQIAPCSAVHAVRLGMAGLSPAERARLMLALAIRGLPDDGYPDSGTADPSMLAEAEQRLLEKAANSERLDSQFLTGRSDASIASLAWQAASADTAREFPEKLSTALSLAPIRRWLCVHLIMRLANVMR